MDPLTRQVLSTTGGKKSTYVDDVFSTHVWVGDGAAHQVVNGIDNAGEGGMVWTKCRSTTYSHLVADTVRGYNYGIFPDATGGQDGPNDNYFKSLNNDGFTTGDWVGANQSGQEFVGWNFRKAPGFFDIVSYTGTGSALTVAHGLGSVPGCIMVKRLDANGYDWTVYHKDLKLDGNQYLILNNTNAAVSGNNRFDQGDPTATHFSVGIAGDVNASGGEYIAYLFAGGESTAATARSVELVSNESLSLAASSDFHMTGDFTIEGWYWCDSYPGAECLWGLGRYDGASPNDGTEFYLASGNLTFYTHGATLISGPKVQLKQWQHIAIVRSGSTVTMYVDGIDVGSGTQANDFGSGSNNTFNIGNAVNSSSTNVDFYDGKISNFRVVNGTAVYTSSFIPPTAPLTNITNTKLLCCNNSSVTGSTVTPGTITAINTPTAKTDNPFDDPEALVFGEDGDQSLIKCGSYIGNNSSDGPFVNLGWEPSWLMVKNAGDPGNWRIFDSIRGLSGDGVTDNFLEANSNIAQVTNLNCIDVSARNFQPKSSDTNWNSANVRYAYIAIRRPDGYVGKPAEAGTESFAMDTGASSGVIPNFDSGFPVDFQISKIDVVSGTGNWYSGARLTGKQYAHPNTAAAVSDSNNWVWDSNVGWQNGGGSWPSTSYSWMWKRGAGFDVIAYTGNGETRRLPHGLGRVPEMVWAKSRGSAYDWFVYHKGLNGGYNPAEYKLNLNSVSAEGSAGITLWRNTVPDKNVFTIGNIAEINQNSVWQNMMLFASVDGISKVGYYTGDGTSNNSLAITTGFTPRFVIIKRTDNSGNWLLIDTLRGFTKYLRLSLTLAEDTQTFITATATGFTLNDSDGDANASGGKYIYYAHA